MGDLFSDLYPPLNSIDSLFLFVGFNKTRVFTCTELSYWAIVEDGLLNFRAFYLLS